VKVHVVTEDEAEAGKFVISDVVVPRGGHGLSAEVLATPAGKMLERYLWYDELDLAQGLEVELCQQTTDEEGWYHVPCAFRRLISRPSDVVIHFPPEGETEPQTQGGGAYGDLGTASSRDSKGHGGEDEDEDEDEDEVASSASTNLSAPLSPSSQLNVSDCTCLSLSCLSLCGGHVGAHTCSVDVSICLLFFLHYLFIYSFIHFRSWHTSPVHSYLACSQRLPRASTTLTARHG
jgi:hypothetical protein